MAAVLLCAAMTPAMDRGCRLCGPYSAAVGSIASMRTASYGKTTPFVGLLHDVGVDQGMDVAINRTHVALHPPGRLADRYGPPSYDRVLPGRRRSDARGQIR